MNVACLTVEPKLVSLPIPVVFQRIIAIPFQQLLCISK